MASAVRHVFSFFSRDDGDGDEKAAAEERKEEAEDVEERPLRPLRLPDFVNRCLEICRCGVRRRVPCLVAFHAALAALAVGTVVCAVLYGHTYRGMPSLAVEGGEGEGGRDWVQIGLFAATVVLPLITIAAQSREPTVPDSGNYRRAAAQIEGEAFKFRARVSPYDDNDNKGKDERDDGGSDREGARGILVARLREILETLRADAGAAGGVAVPQDDDEAFWDAGGDSAVAQEKEPFVSEVAEEAEEPMDFEEEPINSYDEEFAELPRGIQWQDLGRKVAAFSTTEETPLLESKEIADAPKGEVDETEGPDKTPDAEEEPPPPEDDGVSELVPASYVRCRFEPGLARQRRLLARLELYRTSAQRLIALDNLCCVGAAAASLQWSVPMLLVVAAAVDRAVQVAELPRRIEAARRSVSELEELEARWRDEAGEEEAQRRQFEELVEKTEAALLEAAEL